MKMGKWSRWLSLMIFTFSITILVIDSQQSPQPQSAGTIVSKQRNKVAQAKLKRVLITNHFSGTAMLVKYGRPIAQYAVGQANHTKHVKNSLNTMYEIDSIQKIITAALIMQQVQRGKLRLNDKLSRFYPQISHANVITIRQMLDMTSGLAMNGTVGPTKLMNDGQIIKSDSLHVRYDPLLHGKWNYQPVNYNLLTGVLEKVGHISYAKMVQEQFIYKLHLRHTALAFKRPRSYAMANGYNQQSYQTPQNMYDSMVFPNLVKEHDELGTGQLYMSTHDLYKVTQAILSGKIISSKSCQQLYRAGSASGYGGGFYARQQKLVVNGAGYGFESTLRVNRNGQTAVILLSNYQIKGMGIKRIADHLDGLADW